MKRIICIIASMLLVACSCFFFACGSGENGNISGTYIYNENDAIIKVWLNKDGSGIIAYGDDGVYDEAQKFTYKILEENKSVALFFEGDEAGEISSYKIVGDILTFQGLAFEKQK